jgi:hypothetical protein
MFGMNPSDDPVKSAYFMAGLSLLTSNDPNAALNNLPQMVMEAKRYKGEMDLKKRQLAIQEAGLGMDREKLAIYKDENTRAKQKQADETELGKMFAAFDLNPSTAGNFPIPGGMVPGGSGEKKDIRTSTDDWLASEMVDTQGKGDAAMPMGTEGNPMAQQLMALPAPMRAALAKSPIASGAMVAPALTQKMTDVLDVPGSTSEKSPQIKTFTDGKETVTLDMNNDGDYARFRQLGPEFVEAPAKVIESAVEDPNKGILKTYEDEIVKSREAANVADEEVDKYAQLGSLLLRKDMYIGAGAPLVNSLLSSAQDIFGVLPDKDFSTLEAADKSRKDIVMGIRASYPKDQQMSNADREYYQSMSIGQENKPETVARVIAVKQLAGEVKRAKADFLEDAVLNKKMSHYEAVKAWKKIEKKTRTDIVNEESIQEVMGALMKGANDDSLIEHLKKLTPGAAKKIGEETGMTEPPAAAPGSSADNPIDIVGPNDYKVLKPGTYYTDPDGVLRRKE